MNMHFQQQWPDDETWQRVVDNDLTAGELKKLFAACEQRPELWRCCALAFLEDQAVRSELKLLAAQWQEPFVQAQSTRRTVSTSLGQDAAAHRSDDPGHDPSHRKLETEKASIA